MRRSWVEIIALLFGCVLIASQAVAQDPRHLAECPEARPLHDLLLAQLELDELALEPKDPLRDAEPSVELVGIGNEI